MITEKFEKWYKKNGYNEIISDTSLYEDENIQIGLAIGYLLDHGISPQNLIRIGEYKDKKAVLKWLLKGIEWAV